MSIFQTKLTNKVLISLQSASLRKSDRAGQTNPDTPSALDNNTLQKRRGLSADTLSECRCTDKPALSKVTQLFFNYPSCLAEVNKVIIFGIFQRLT